MAQQQTGKQRLIYSVLKFLDGEIRAESANTERRESLEGISLKISYIPLSFIGYFFSPFV